MTLPNIFSTREEYLSLAVNELAMAVFAPVGYEVPVARVRVSCGWPVGSRGAAKSILGQCFHPKASKAGNIEIFISPVTDCPEKAIGILAHELVHATVGNEAGHGPVFKACATAIGLTGKMTSAMPGDALAARIRVMIHEQLGAYPHAAVDFNNRKKQGTRMILLRCPVTGYQVRATQKWISLGLPTSPAGYQMEVVG